jgi:glutaredoxin
MREVVLYTRSGCCLCDEAKAALQVARAQVQFTVREVDIDSDPALYDAHRYDVPVIEIDGRRAFKHRVTPRQLVDRLSR